jgi:uncharacterized protein YbjT (DUF2867 family)
MRLLVLGGTGKVGRHVLGQALAAGHEVLALARGPVDGCPAVRADPLDGDAVRRALAGCDAVVSSLGLRRRHVWNPWSPILGPATFCADSARVLVTAMRDAGVGRVVAVSAAGVAESAPGMNAVIRGLVATSSIGVAYRDLAAMEQVYADSGLDWTCVRPVTLTDGPGTGRWRIVDQFGATMVIPRADVAACLLTLATRPHVGPRCPQIAG